MGTERTQLIEYVKYELRLRELSLAAVARDLGITRQAVSKALRTSPFSNTTRAILKKIGILDPQTLWPNELAKSKGHAKD
jgi:lambda repressor-like predicted transcriptional regulator